MTNPVNGSAAAQFVASMPDRVLPEEVATAAKMCLVDWCGVALGAHKEPAGKAVRKAVSAWRASGKAQALLGASMAPAAAALINGTLAHCLDFDDTHVDSVAHLSGPTWAAVLASGAESSATEMEMLKAFVAGYEVGARLGGAGFGVTVDHHGWHSTGIFGCLAAAAGSSAILGLNQAGIARALGAAATQVSGLTASFGTMAKPLHAGKAAFNGLFAAQLSAAGFGSAEDLLEPGGGLATTLVQDQSDMIQKFRLDSGWEVTRNTFKPYACCLLTHAAIDAAQSLADALRGKQVVAIEARVNPLAVQLAGRANPQTPLEGKFSTSFCVALGLAGHAVSEHDFSALRLKDKLVCGLARLVTLVPDVDMAKTAATLRIKFADGTQVETHTPLTKGNPGNPMSWEDLRQKFFPLVEPSMKDRTSELFEILRTFERPGQYARFSALVRR